ncbi:hypothetical protein [Oceanospirillum sediminis]|uniref:Nucleotidyl transferase AbiEii/AbiGii toxin family protein n=1 Tax=Oceanospirillum sediminis TaxID=2760088 RepID=A0A839ISA1_9GAMM|nr:hypothetical protein [Oceanospirillum sediminis]MBB1487540.1 hypothetical protein [Oceanospirillum sediminis]
MDNYALHQQMLIQVAKALGADLLDQVTFVGGCTTGLLITDELILEQVRHTDDVDLIVHVIGYTDYQRLQKKLRQSGFSDASIEDDDMPICAMKLGELRVDFMPDQDVLGFSNIWYKSAMETAETHVLPDGTQIKVVNPVYFIATKIEAYKNRGNNDPMSSRDIEDLLNVVDGRDMLLEEIACASNDVKNYIQTELSTLLNHQDFVYAVQSQVHGDTDREEIVFQRLEAIQNWSGHI